MEFTTLARAPLYEINKAGVIRRKDNKKVSTIYHTVRNYAYCSLIIEKGRGGKKLKAYVHRMMAETFIDNPNNYPFVLHLDDDPANYQLDNLAWGTQKMNMQQSSNTGFYSTVKREVDLINPHGEIVHVKGLRPFAKENGLDWGNFQKLLKGRNKSIKGWRLAPKRNGIRLAPLCEQNGYAPLG